MSDPTPEDAVRMEFVRTMDHRIAWRCPECGHTTMTAKSVIAFCTKCGDPS